MCQNGKKILSILQHIHYMFANSSTHGGNWLPRIPSPSLQIAYMLMLGCLQVTMMVVFVLTLFFPSMPVFTSLNWNDAKTIEFPNMTVCHPRAYNLERVQSNQIYLRQSYHQCPNHF